MTTMMKRNGNGYQPATTSFSGLVDKLFQDNLSRFFNDGFGGFGSRDMRSTVPVNIRETDKDYQMELVAPGLKKEDFRINISGDMLTVSFERKEEEKKENEAEGWLRREYRMQSFSRSFSLDDSVDANGITARYNDGVLCLTLPKKEGAQALTRTIEIS